MLMQFSSFMSTVPYQEVWAIRKQFFDTQFRNFVEELDSVDFRLVGERDG